MSTVLVCRLLTRTLFVLETDIGPFVPGLCSGERSPFQKSFASAKITSFTS